MTVAELFAKLSLNVDEASFKKGEAAIGGISGVLAGIGLTAAALRAGVEALVNETANAIGATNRGAQSAQIARDKWAELAHAADENGLSVEEFGNSMKFLNRAAADAAEGGKESAHAFRRLGVAVKDGNGHAKTADVLFEQIVERWKSLPEGPEKAALAMKLFGRSGVDMIPMLNKGGESLAEFRKEAHELGKVFSDEDYDAAKRYKRSLHELGDEVEAVKLAIGKSLLKEAGGAAKAIAEWLKANREWIATKIHDAVEFLSDAWKTAKGVLDPFVRLFVWLISRTWLLKIATVALGIALAVAFGNSARKAWAEGLRLLAMVRGITASQLLGAAAAIGWGLAWAAGIALALGAIEELYGWITGDRKTLLGEWLGPFADFKKKVADWFETSDSPLAKMARGIADAFERAAAAVKWIRSALGIGGNTATPDQKAAAEDVRKRFDMLGAYTQEALSKNPRFAELVRAGDFAGLNREFLSGNDPGALRTTTTPGPVSVTVPVTVTAPAGTADPDAWGAAAGRAASRTVAEELQGIFNAAHEAVGY